MQAASVAVIDLLISLLDAEHNSVFRLMGEGSPYLRQAPPEVRQRLAEMVRSCHHHGEELADLIRRLGGTPPPQPPLPQEDQLIGYLSLKFLLPKLVNTKELMIERYQNALRAIGKEGPPEVPQLLRRHLALLREDLTVLRTLHPA